MRSIAARPRLSPMVVALAALSLVAADGHLTAQAQIPPAAGVSYTLVDTWRDRPWTLTPGRVMDPADVTSTTDGRTVVLDRRSPMALHLLAGPSSDDTVAVLPGGIEGVRIDAGPDDALAVLTSRFPFDAEAVWLDTLGRVQGRVALPKSPFVDAYTDVSVGPDGRLYVGANDRVDIEDEEASARIYVLKPDGAIEDEIDLNRWFQVDHSLPNHFHPRLRSIDVGPDGRLFALMMMVPCT